MATTVATGRNPEKRMSLGEHLVELRKRLFRAALAIAAGTVGGWFVSEFILDALRDPVTALARAQGRDASLNFVSITGAFDLRFQIAITAGAIISSPIWLYQIFAFLVPGLTRKEKKYTFGFFFSAVPLFAAGCAAGWYVLPHIVGLMTGFAGQGDTTLLDAKGYYDFVLKLVIAVGVAFVLPVFLVLLNFVGVLSAKTILKSWRIALLVIVLFTAIATPSADIFSMFLLAIPMVALYFAAAGVAWLHDRSAARRLAKIDEDPAFADETL